jgi:D-erythro-7,8-dihydroneopterin triphosphate epimerase
MDCDQDRRDVIFIRDLLVRCIVGIRPEEREKAQDVIFNIRLFADTRPAAASDSIEDAVDYSTLKKRIVGFAEASSYNLVETLAQQAADLCLADPRVTGAEVTVEKPTALRFARTVGVRIYREKNKESL